MLDALKAAAAEGARAMPFVNIHICHECKGVKLISSRGGLALQQIRSWEQLEAAVNPTDMLVDTIHKMREVLSREQS